MKFSWGSPESVKKFVETLQKALETAPEKLTHFEKMCVILASNMTGPSDYRSLANLANTWMADAFAVSPESQALSQLSEERPVKAFNGRNEIWKMQTGTGDFSVLCGEAGQEEKKGRLKNFDMTPETYQALTPELVNQLKERFKR